MRALITGGGFVASWLTRALKARGDRVTVAGLAGARHDAESAGAEFLEADFRSSEAVDRAIEASHPDAVFHLAGVAFPPDVDRSPEAAFDVNALGVVRLIAAIEKRRSAGLDPVVLVVGTSVQYGRHPAAAMPLVESASQEPVSAYAASKAAQEVIALQAFRRTGLRVICTRSFNHSGVGHPSQYLLPALVARVRRIRRGEDATLKLGNDVIRDYLHVSDVVTAYLSLIERGRAGEAYNVSSGKGVSVRELAATVLQRAGVTAEISTEASLVRASDIPTLIGSPAKLQRDTGWQPTKTYADIIDDLLHAEAD